MPLFLICNWGFCSRTNEIYIYLDLKWRSMNFSDFAHLFLEKSVDLWLLSSHLFLFENLRMVAQNGPAAH